MNIIQINRIIILFLLCTDLTLTTIITTGKVSHAEDKGKISNNTTTYETVIPSYII
jgi:hypothetical protein